MESDRDGLFKLNLKQSNFHKEAFSDSSPLPRKLFYFIVRLAPHPRLKVFAELFSKSLWGGGATPPMNGVFFLIAFLFCNLQNIISFKYVYKIKNLCYNKTTTSSEYFCVYLGDVFLSSDKNACSLLCILWVMYKFVWCGS